jgi:hypothetical protein
MGMLHALLRRTGRWRASACSRWFGPYAAVQRPNGRAWLSVSRWSPLPSWEQLLGRLDTSHCATATVAVLPEAHFPTPPRSSALAYRITLSAWKSSVGGIVRPSASAVLRLMTSSYLDACSTGRSAGLAPLRILSM